MSLISGRLWKLVTCDHREGAHEVSSAGCLSFERRDNVAVPSVCYRFYLFSPPFSCFPVISLQLVFMFILYYILFYLFITFILSPGCCWGLSAVLSRCIVFCNVPKSPRVTLCNNNKSFVESEIYSIRFLTNRDRLDCYGMRLIFTK